MTQSKYISLVEIDNNNILLYSTFNTSLIVLPKQIYESIFVQQCYENDEYVSQLKSLGFLVEDDTAQLKQIESIRKQNLSSGEQVVNIFSTNNCNARCYYCFENGIDMVDMSEQTADATVEFIKEYYPQKKLKIIWFGGEPLYNFSTIIRITKALKEAGYLLSCHVTTNGSLVSQEIIDFLSLNYDRVSFQVTIDELGNDYGKIKRYIDCDVQTAFERTINACHLLIRNSIILSIRVNYLDKQIEAAKKVFMSLYDTFSYADKEKFLIYLAPLTLLESCQGCPDSSNHLLELLRFHYEKGVYKNIRSNKCDDLLSLFNLMPKGGACRAANKMHITITAEGKIFPCNRYAKYNNYSIGDVLTGINKNNSFYKFFYNWQVVEEKCKTCSILPICQGGCKALKTLYKKKDFVCQRKDIQSDLLRMFYTKLFNK